MIDFLVHKIIDLLIKPSNWLILGAVLGVCGGLLLRRRWLTTIGAVFLVLFTVLSIVPVGEWMMVPLENRYPTADRYPEKVDGVVAIGNRISKNISEKRGEPAIVGDGQPFLALMEFAERYPDAKLILTGIGESTDSWPADLSDFVKQYYAQLGFDPERITYEPYSLTMGQFAENTYDLAEPREGENWYLAASAHHMPRAMVEFENAGWEIEAWPVSFRTAGEYDPIAPHMRVTYYHFLIDFALNEWIALTNLWLQGKTPSIWAPVQRSDSSAESSGL